MISQSIAWGYVIIIGLMLLFCGIQEVNINSMNRENAALRKENQEIKRKYDTAGVRIVALQVANDKLTKDLEATTRELKVAEKIMEKAGA